MNKFLKIATGLSGLVLVGVSVFLFLHIIEIVWFGLTWFSVGLLLAIPVCLFSGLALLSFKSWTRILGMIVYALLLISLVLGVVFNFSHLEKEDLGWTIVYATPLLFFIYILFRSKDQFVPLQPINWKRHAGITLILIGVAGILSMLPIENVEATIFAVSVLSVITGLISFTSSKISVYATKAMYIIWLITALLKGYIGMIEWRIYIQGMESLGLTTYFLHPLPALLLLVIPLSILFIVKLWFTKHTSLILVIAYVCMLAVLGGFWHSIIPSQTVVALGQEENKMIGADNRRYGDLWTIHEAIKLYLDEGNTFSKCELGREYTSANTNNYGPIDGTGWLPVDFTKMSSPPFERLDFDINTLEDPTSHFSFACDPKKNLYELNMKPIVKREWAINDSGNNPDIYEIGNDLELLK
jgi:hypothetical protein